MPAIGKKSHEKGMERERERETARAGQACTCHTSSFLPHIAADIQ